MSGVKQQITEDELAVPHTKLPFGELIVLDGKSILWLNSPLGDFDFDRIEVDFLIISNNAIKSLKQLEAFILADQIILDKSNSFYTQRSLLEEAKENRVDIHQVSANGYFSSLWRK